nr:tetratricopeptide repeat protein [uncultured Treponema sp.]
MSVCKKSLIAVTISAFVFAVPCVAQSASFDSDSVNVNVLSSREASSTYADALKAYSRRDWKTSIFLFKKLHTNQADITPESLYMQIMTQTYDGQYKQAVNDCDLFLKEFSNNQYAQLVMYQKGKILYQIEDYEKSILTLSDFCHSNPKHKLYSSALFWIAESFYATYNFDSAKSLYERIVVEFPDDSKARDAQFRLDVIAQRSREEKLLYLLKQTGEDYLSSKESYEKTLKQYQIENSVGVNSQLRELRQQNENLDNELANEKKRTAELESQVRGYEADLEKTVRELKQQADEALELLNRQEGM